MRKYYKVPYTGALVEIDATEYARVLRVAVQSDHHARLSAPMHGFVYQGNGYFVMESE